MQSLVLFLNVKSVKVLSASMEGGSSSSSSGPCVTWSDVLRAAGGGGDPPADDPNFIAKMLQKCSERGKGLLQRGKGLTGWVTKQQIQAARGAVAAAKKYLEETTYSASQASACAAAAGHAGEPILFAWAGHPDWTPGRTPGVRTGIVENSQAESSIEAIVKTHAASEQYN